MSERSARFELPFIQPGQAQKELYHNEALALADALLHPAVEGAALAQEPEAPIEGQCWIVGPGATGGWSGKDRCLAAWTSGGWRFVAPVPGLRVWDKQQGYWVHWTGSSWSSGELPAGRIEIAGKQVVSARQPPILSPSGGTTIDVEARGALNQIIATLMSHGLIG